MQPIVFPFTLIEERLMEAMGRFFQKVAVYQVMASAVPLQMRTWQEQQRLDIRLPLGHHARELAVILSDYQAWAREHQGGDLSFFKVKGDAVPFFNDTSVAQIRRDIRKKSRPATTAAKEAPLDLYPGVFLQMAQDLDVNSREIAGELESQVRSERDLMQALKGNVSVTADVDRDERGAPDDHYRYMIPERVAAWSRLLAVDGLEEPLLITTQRAVVDELGERAAAAGKEPVLLQTVKAVEDEPGALRPFQRALLAWLERLSATAWDEGQAPPVFAHAAVSQDSGPQLSLHLFPGLGPHELLGVGADSTSAAVNTVVGVVSS